MKPRFSSVQGLIGDNVPPPLPRRFFERPVLQVARDCIGKLLISRIGGSIVGGRIVETEAYRGPEDRAAHSFGGRRTARTEVMFGPAGFAYVFLIYGIHYNFNIVTGKPGAPEAVLIRAVEPLFGLETMQARRGLAAPQGSLQLSNGPGKLCQALGITLQHNGRDLTQGELTLAEGNRVRVARSPRIGIDYAGEWALKPWRFYAANSPHVSRFRAPRLRAPL